MLVLSRRERQRILFPNLGVTVAIVRICGNVVRVGVEAPPHVRVLRSEIASDADQHVSATPDARAARHELRNRLNCITLALSLIQKQIDQGLLTDAAETLQSAVNDLGALDKIAAAASPAPVECPTCRHRALLVDDDANERELLAGLLRLSGYEVDVVEDGMAAMTYLSEHSPPDCVLLDMQMPRMDGQSTVTAIRSMPGLEGIKVFAVTGLDQGTTDLPLGENGVNRWFSKPLQPAEFIQDLETELHPQMTVA